MKLSLEQDYGHWVGEPLSIIHIRSSILLLDFLLEVKLELSYLRALLVTNSSIIPRRGTRLMKLLTHPILTLYLKWKNILLLMELYSLDHTSLQSQLYHLLLPSKQRK